MPTGKNANDIRSYLKEYEIKTGKKVDVLLVDYLDLMHPIAAKISAENLFVKDKYVSEELRNLAMELNTIFVTASQLNRSSVEEIEFDHSHISGGISKINTADNLIGIFTSRAMRERGRYQIQLMKTRSSSGVGQKIDLAFDVDTLRITDLGEDDQEQATVSSSGSSIVNALKRTNTPSETPDEGVPAGKIRAEADSTKLRSFLNNLGD
jgi:replicative DNA helicase